MCPLGIGNFTNLLVLFKSEGRLKKKKTQNTKRGLPVCLSLRAVLHISILAE